MIREYRVANNGFHSLVIIFKEPVNIREDLFEEIMWRRLQSLRHIDATHFAYDNRVSPGPSSTSFSFSLMEEAFFIIALHPSSSRMARRFSYPALVFNPHAQFENLRRTGSYERIKKVNRMRLSLALPLPLPTATSSISLPQLYILNQEGLTETL